MAVTTRMLQDFLLPKLFDGSVNALWVGMGHSDQWKLVSRRRWIQRWRADHLGHSAVRARRVWVQATTKVVR